MFTIRADHSTHGSTYTLYYGVFTSQEIATAAALNWHDSGNVPEGWDLSVGEIPDGVRPEALDPTYLTGSTPREGTDYGSFVIGPNGQIHYKKDLVKQLDTAFGPLTGVRVAMDQLPTGAYFVGPDQTTVYQVRMSVPENPLGHLEVRIVSTAQPQQTDLQAQYVPEHELGFFAYSDMSTTHAWLIDPQLVTS